MVDEILREARCELHNLDAIAYGRGPGSFTGLRICMGIVQGLAFGANLSVIPISTLQAMAQGFSAEHPHNNLPLLVALDARMEEIYWGLFAANNQPLTHEFVVKPAQLLTQSEIVDLNRQFVAIGPGWHYEDLRSLMPAQVIQSAQPNAKDILYLALNEFAIANTVSILDAQPVYLRDSVSWQKRQRIRTESL